MTANPIIICVNLFRPTYDWMHKMSVRHKAKRKKKVPLVFKHLEPKELAEQLTYMEFKAIRRISVLFFCLFFFKINLFQEAVFA